MVIAALRRACMYVFGALTSAGVTARAQGPPPPTLVQLAHRAWTTRDGAPGGVTSLAQSSDGFLWIGTASGLFNFDGVHFERYEPPAGQSMPSQSVNALLALDNGSLAIGYSVTGVSVLTANRLVSYGERQGLPPGTVTSLARDSTGSVWVATTRGLARLVGERWQRMDAANAFPGGMTTELAVDRRGALWVATMAGVYMLPRGAMRFVRRAPPLAVGEREMGSGYIRVASDGSVWGSSLSRGLIPLADSLGAQPSVHARGRSAHSADRGWWGMFMDREGNAWSLVTAGRLSRVALGTGAAGRFAGRAAWDTMTFSPATGMSGGSALAFLQDREGTIWVGTDRGVDQFRAPKFMAVQWPDPSDIPPIAAGDSGALWLAGVEHPLASYATRLTSYPGGPVGITAAHRDFEGDLWFGGLAGLWHLRGKAITRVALPAELEGGLMKAIAVDRSGVLWVASQRRSVFRRRAGRWEPFTTADRLALAIVPDSGGRVWLGYGEGRLIRVAGDSVREFGPADGLQVGAVLTVHARGDRVWVGGELGVATMDSGRTRFAPFVVRNGALRGVGGIVETTGGELWLHNADGVARVTATEVRRALRDSAYRATADHFDARDRIDGPATANYSPSAVLGTDGRIWFTYLGAVASVDPAHLRRNRTPPPVTIRGASAGGQDYAAGRALTLPARTNGLTIAYTALSLAVPERVRFRYRLIGLDTAWQDVGARREAVFTNLGPGSYRFHVIAANDDGLWNDVGASLDFVIPPTFVQTKAFLALCAVAAAGALWLLVAWRQRRVADAIRARFDATLAERTRIAQELHDTLLQGFTSVALQVHAARRMLGADTEQAGEVLSQAAATADATLRDARHAVWEMRAPELDELDLVGALRAAAHDALGSAPIELTVTVHGVPRRLPAAVEVATLRIGREAVTNAARHARAQSVEVTLDYGLRTLTITVRDDGRGLTPDDIDAARRAGHWGLVGMRERAAAAGGTLEIIPAPGRGTLISATLPTVDAGA